MAKRSAIAAVAARIIMGTIFVVFGLNGFFNFIPVPPMPEAAGAFLGGLAGAGYMFPMIKGTEIIVGLLLLSNRFVPLALILISPVLVNIVAFHLFLAPSGLALPIVLSFLQLYLAWSYRAHFRSVLEAKASPVQGQPALSTTAQHSAA